MMSPADLDIESPGLLVHYLQRSGHIANDEHPFIRVLAGGVSNRVVLVRRSNGEAWVLKQALPKLRVPIDWFSSPERVHREAEALRWLRALGLNVPALRFEDPLQHLLAMEAVPEPNENWKTSLLAGRLKLKHVEAFAAILGHLHTRSSRRRDELKDTFEDRSYFESLRIEPYYQYSAEQIPAARSFLEDVIESTRATCVCLVHGDFSPKNVLVHDDELILLDHEVVHFGDPAFDVGFSLTHLLSKAHHLRAHRRRFEEASVRYWTVYSQTVAAESWSSGLEPRAVRNTLACLLARVAGRSRLEYLDRSEQERQTSVVLSLMAKPPAGVHELVSQFVERI